MFVALGLVARPTELRADQGPSAKHLPAAEKPAAQPAKATVEGDAWSVGSFAAQEVAAGRPLVIRVFVPLCSNDQIQCGSGPAGRAGDLSTNLYWGAVFGARHFFDRKKSGWERLSVIHDVEGELERVAYRRWIDGAAWNRKERVEEIAVLSAVHGDSIDRAVRTFWNTAALGGSVSFDDAGTKRTEHIAAVGYAGHDRLMDGIELPAEPKASTGKALPTFVFACYSEKYFGPALRRVGADPLVTTKALMAPEAYVIDAALTALGDNVTQIALRKRVVAAYAKWQRLEIPVASSMFQ